MKNSIAIVSVLFFIALFFSSCEDTNSIDDKATLLDLNTIQNEVGYSWFYMEVYKYEPDQDIIAQIKEVFDPEVHTFLTFSEPSCSCDSRKSTFSFFVKVLLEADVPDSNLMMYSLSNPKTEHPYSDVVSFDILPQLYVLKDSEIIMDVLKEKNDYAQQHPDEDISFEELILEALNR